MKRSLALVSVVGLFLLGIVVGGLGMHLYDARHPFSGPPRDGARQSFHAERLDQLLDLTPEQEARIDEIRREGRAEQAVHVLAPEAVLSEGIAVSARSMIFSDSELAAASSLLD